MKNIKRIINLLTAAVLLGSCSESLEGTYSEYAGDGKIRYVAKCTEFHATPKWERLLVEWKNGTDATIDKIKVMWSYENYKDSVLLPNTTTSYELENLTDGTYRFDICAMDAAGNESLRETTYGRPYTRQHEVMRAFTRGILKSYFLKNKIIFNTDQWNENIIEIKLKYKDTEGNTKYYVFDKDISYNNLITINNASMNLTDTVYILRTGKLEDCPDVIEFDPLAISRKKNFSAGFVNAIQRRYGYSTETKEQEAEFEAFVEKAEELEFDYDIETFEDVLYCPNLKKLIFGKNRYLNEKYASEYDDIKLLGSMEKNIQILDKANEPDVLDLTIDSYGGWFSIRYFEPGLLAYMNDMGYSELPPLEVIGMDALRVYDDGNRVLCSPTDPYAKLDNLLDDNSTTRWETTSYSSIRRYEMQMELKEATEIRGIKVAQVLYDPRYDRQAPYFMPLVISIQTSIDGAKWENVTFFETNELGRGSGEVTLLPIAEGTRQIRYVKFSLRDGIDQGGFCMSKLGDIVLYK